jgi:two-component system, NarL family, response regulator DesR
MRKALAACLEERGLTVCAEVGDDQALLEVATRVCPDVCLVDADLPGESVRAARKLHSRVPETAVVFFGGSVTGGDVVRAIRAGAAGYMPRHARCDDLARAVASLADGEVALPQGFVALSNRGRVTLTQRQAQVLGMLTRGASATEIARSLAISPVTARRHCAEIRRKLGATDRRLVEALADHAD